jgi:hypothetical protein
MDQSNHNNLNAIQLMMAFALKGLACLPLCTYLSKEGERDYLQLLLLSVELSIGLASGDFAHLPFILLEALLVLSAVAYS